MYSMIAYLSVIKIQHDVLYDLVYRQSDMFEWHYLLDCAQIEQKRHVTLQNQRELNYRSYSKVAKWGRVGQVFSRVPSPFGALWEYHVSDP